MHALEELSCGLCDDILVIGARFPLDVEMDNVILVDCMESDNSNSIQFDHAFAAETACNYLTSQGRRQIALIHPHGSGFADQVLLGYKHALEKNFLPFVSGRSGPGCDIKGSRAHFFGRIYNQWKRPK